jgi:hypothetical protein
MNPFFVGAVRATVEDIVGLDPMPDDLAAAVGARWG